MNELTKLALADLGVQAELFPGFTEILKALEKALSLIEDPILRQEEFATALAEMRDGKIPTIIAEVVL